MRACQRSEKVAFVNGKIKRVQDIEMGWDPMATDCRGASEHDFIFFRKKRGNVRRIAASSTKEKPTAFFADGNVDNDNGRRIIYHRHGKDEGDDAENEEELRRILSNSETCGWLWSRR